MIENGILWVLIRLASMRRFYNIAYMLKEMNTRTYLVSNMFYWFEGNYNEENFQPPVRLKVYCVYSLDWPHRGDSNEYTQYICVGKNMQKSNTCLGFVRNFLEKQLRVQNSNGKRAISV